MDVAWLAAGGCFFAGSIGLLNLFPVLMRED